LAEYPVVYGFGILVIRYCFEFRISDFVFLLKR